MGVLKIMGLFAIVPATMLVTVSFFVMFTLSKLEKGVLRIFGMVAVSLLWISAFTVFSGGIYLSAQAPDLYHGQSFSKSCSCPQCSCCCQCPCGSMSGSGCANMMDRDCGFSKEPYHKMMMNPHAGMLMDPHHGMMRSPSGQMPCKTKDMPYTEAEK